ncbi:SET domain-containing protein [Panus rudis PR-1116 ss-1]|nr:SET domain-containing protein [Panus rudis PR-1116 ss-1]
MFETDDDLFDFEDTPTRTIASETEQDEYEDDFQNEFTPAFDDEEQQQQEAEEEDEDEEIFEWFAERHEKIRATAVQAYKYYWDLFYSWEPGECRQLLSSLAAPSGRSFSARYPDGLPLGDLDDEEQMDLYDELVDDDDDDTPIVFLVQDFDEDVQTTFRCSARESLEVEYYPPCSAYTAVTPSNWNIQTEPTAYTNIRFIPYDGEPRFPVIEYLKMEEVESFAWQSSWRDPDFDLIASATIKHLLEQNEEYDEDQYLERITPEDIDDCLPFRYRDVMFRTSLRRDMFYWPGSATLDNEHSINTSQGPEVPPYGLYDQVTKAMQRLFCPYIDCLKPMCITHPLGNWEKPDPEPTLTSQQLRSKCQVPCGTDCFILKDEESLADISAELESYSQDVKDVITLVPDDSPCDIALICKRPCYEVFIVRCHVLHDDIVAMGREEKSKSKLFMTFIDDRPDVASYVLDYPCIHSGPCDFRAKCSCYLNKQHCQRNCACDLKCNLRKRGCRCLSTNICGSENGQGCICAKKSWECDPELCILKKPHQKIKQINKKKNHSCNMTALQKHKVPYIAVQSGSYGLGVFALQDIKEHTFIGEYTAEIFAHTDMTRDLPARHTGLNYSFTLSSCEILDAIAVGNETRYMNHSNEIGEMNVDARTRLVNGIHRIAFFSMKDIKKGEELLFDYGQGFFPSV